MSPKTNNPMNTDQPEAPAKQRRQGRPKGTLNKRTLDKIAAREYVREKVMAVMDSLLDAQIANATGISHLMMRDPQTGKFERVATDAEDSEVAAAQIDAALRTGHAFWIFTKSVYQNPNRTPAARSQHPDRIKGHYAGIRDGNLTRAVIVPIRLSRLSPSTSSRTRNCVPFASSRP
jgi:hypothetical protein